MPTSQTGQRQKRPAGTADAQTGDSKSASTTVGSAPRAERKIEVRTVAPPAAGTLTGLGEAFQGPGQSGSAELTIPCTVTPARGLEPQLTLRYDSGGHNGVFGQGAGLGLSSVTLSNNRQMPTYDGADPSALDGAALVPVPDSAEQRNAGGSTFTVTLYRPRHQTDFARIERWSPDNGGVCFWRTLSRDDEIAVYGTSAAARISDPDDAARVFEWLIEARYDPRGNAVRYRYKAEDRSGVTPPEPARRYDANRYPQRISYGNARPFVATDPLDLPDGAWLFDVLFDYGEYRISPDNDSPAVPVGPWTMRPDPFSSYAAGFERRTCRLCRNILMVHHFPAELGADDVLVRVMALSYDENPYASRLNTIAMVGWHYVASRPSGKRYAVRQLPPVQLDWTGLPVTAPKFDALTLAPGTLPPRFGAPPPYGLVDLDGSGLPGVLYADGTTVAYIAPALAAADVNAELIYQAAPVPDFPIPRVADGPAALIDLDGDGRLSLSWSSPELDGYYPPRTDGGWQPFRPFRQSLLDRASQPAEFADLTGDGRADRVRVDIDTLVYNRNLGRDGFAPSQRRARSHGLPLTAPPPPNADVRFVDVLGGGTSPAVLVRSGSLRCWPNLGYGRFGDPIDLAAPIWPETIGPDRVLLADLTGTGCADLIIVLTDRLRIYRNQAGNGFTTTALEVTLPAALRGMDQIHTADMSGMGCQALVFTTDEPASRHFVCDLAAGNRPGLIERIDDSRGRVIALSYASSARFQLLDRLEGRPWITTLASPLPVLSRVEQIDEVAHVTRVIEYRYSHGYFDPVEREFRGFGLVEARERDAPFTSLAQSIGDVPALLRREWYHTGAVLTDESLEEAFAREYWQGDPRAFPMPPSCFDWQRESPDAATWREAVSALAGTLLRSEEFAVDTPDAPFVVEASNALVRMDQPRIGGHHAVFVVAPREHVRCVYDGEAPDPSISHDVALEIDAFGDVALAAEVACARRPDQPDTVPEQQRVWINVSRAENLPPQQGPDLWLAGLPWQARRWTLPHPPHPTVRGLYYDFAMLLTTVRTAIDPGGDAELLEWSRLVYVGADGGEAPPQAVAPQALVMRNELAAFNAAELADVFRDAEPPDGLAAFLAGQGYQKDQTHGLWWNPGLTQTYDGADKFFLAIETRDPFAMRHGGRHGTATRYSYDTHRLLITGTTITSTGNDVIPDVTTALVIDYQALEVTSIRDANQQIREALLDPLGDVIATSVRGWEWRDGAPIEVGFAPLPLDDPDKWPQPPDTDAVVADPDRYLGGAASFHFNDLDSWAQKRQPTHSVNIAAQVYPDDPDRAAPQMTISFVDGFDRELQHKMRTEAGAAHTATGLVNTAASERWTTSGGRHYNGLGLPDREYEPYFTDHWNFTDHPELNQLGASITLHYDALGRVIRTDYPKGDMAAAFFSSVVRKPWSQTDWDQDDTIKRSDYYRYYIDPGGHGPLPPGEHDALVKAAAFDNTPRISHLDPRGLVVRIEELLATAETPVSSQVSVYEYDADGNKIAEADPRQAAAGRWNLRLTHGLDGQVVRGDSVDAGTQWSLADVNATPVYGYDLRGTLILLEPDGRSRPSLTRVQVKGAESPIIAERFIYGDSVDAAGDPPLAMPDRRNLMGELCITFDGAGRLDAIGKALSGGTTATVTRLACDPAQIPDWSAGAVTNWPALFAALDPKLETEQFTSTTRFDALDQPLSRIDAGGLTTTWSYRRDGLVAGISAAQPGGAARAYLAATDYNAKDQQLWAEFGDGEGGLLRTEYRYDPDNFRLTGIVTVRRRDGMKLQDLTYWDDPVGNVTSVTDAAAPAARVFHANQEVTPDQDFTYDSLYRLIGNGGRAQTGYTLATAATGGYAPYFNTRQQRQDGNALERYRMSYDYDPSGNLWRSRYAAASSQWTQTLTIAPDSNRGAVTDAGLEGLFDLAGNQLKFQAGVAPALAWSWANRLAAVTLVARDIGEADAQYYAYDTAGTRSRKLTRRLVGGTMVSDETITLGDLAIHRKLRDGTIAEEWRSTRLRDEERCIAELVDWTVGTPPSGVSAHQERYQLDNMIHSSMMEVAGDGSIISYEEYAPFGATVYAAGTSFAEVSLKRYRYAGHDRDQATGLCYYGARYYAPWLLRWLSPDPAGDIDGINLYAFVGGNPVAWVDVGGLGKQKQRTKKDYKNFPMQTRSASMKKRKTDTTEVGMVIGAVNPGAYGDPGKLVEVVQPLPEPSSKRKRDRAEIEESVKNIDRQSLDTHKRRKVKKQSEATIKRRETEVVGETGAFLKMVGQKDTHLAFAVDPGHGAGIDQLYYKQTAKAKQPSEYIVVEAKGPGAKLTNNAFSVKQMSPKWLDTRIPKLSKSADPKRKAWGKKLLAARKKGTPKIYAMTVTTRWNDKTGKLATSQSKRRLVV
jgi:RHS repeat-associated protein